MTRNVGPSRLFEGMQIEEAYQENSTMFLEPLDSECDAPLYAVVEACGKLGFQSPLDVRWCRMSLFVGGHCERARGFHPIRWLFGGSVPPKTACTCGQPLPAMQRCACTFESGKLDEYLFGQCNVANRTHNRRRNLRDRA